MIIGKRQGMIVMACGVASFFVAGRVWKAYGYRPAAVSAYVRDTKDQGVSQKEKDLLQDLIRKIKHDKDPLKDLPDLTILWSRSCWSYKADPYIRAAVALQASSPKQARNALLALAREREDEKVFILCRMLFIGKGGQPLDRPFFGQSETFGGTALWDWPLNPIALVDGVPFFLPTLFLKVAGRTTQPVEYIQYCFREGEWNPYRFHLKTIQEKQQALKKLYASPIWKTRLAPEEKAILADQIQ